MNDTLTYQVRPNADGGTARAGEGQPRDWLAISGPAQLQSSEMAARIAFLERKLAALEARTPAE